MSTPIQSYKKTTPIHVNALVYNHHITKNKLQMKYPLIKDTDKDKVFNVKTTKHV